MSMVENNHLVTINYVVKDKVSGEVLDSNNDKEKPFSFLLGGNQVISGLEAALIGKEVGNKVNVEVAPMDAYGERDNTLLQEVPKDQFSGIDLVKGMTLFGQSSDGQTIQVVVNEIGESSVIIDYNHPLAGKTLVFDIEILGSKEPSEYEILEYSQAGSCGCGHSSGGCCGGGGHHEGGSCGCH